MHIGSGSDIGMKRSSGIGDMDRVEGKDSGKDSCIGEGGEDCEVGVGAGAGRACCKCEVEWPMNEPFCLTQNS